MRQHGITKWASKLELLEELVVGRTVLHLGAVGETCQPLEAKIAAAPISAHAALTKAAEQCIGIDIDAEAVKGLTDAGIFDNLLIADARLIERDKLPLPRVDFIVAGDIIEHLSSPGALLDSATRLSDPGTQLVLTTPNALGLPMFLRYLRGQVLEGPDHKVSFNIYTLKNLLDHHGWEITRLATCYQPKAEQIHGGVGMRVGKAILSRWPSLGGTLFVVAHRVGPSAEAWT